MRKDLHEIEWLDCKIESVVNEANKQTSYIISGPFMKADVPNRNGRVYKREISNSAIAKLRPMVQERRIRMLVDHPEFFSGPKLLNTGAVLIDITDVQDDGYAYYKAKIVDTTVGKELKAIISESKVGVSTRGSGEVREEEIVGYEGKYDVIYDWELSSIDFVDDPAVLDTEAYMKLQVESKKRSSVMFKTVEEIKTNCPDLFKQIVESTTTDVKKEYETKLQEAEQKAKDTAQSFSDKAADLDTLVESIKKIFPEKFTVIEESAIVSEMKNTISEHVNSLQKANEEVDALKKQIKAIEDAHVKAERDNYIEHLKAVDAEFFTLNAFNGCFENCVTKDEVQTVYEANSAIVAEMKAKIITPSPAKTVQTDESSEAKPTGLTEEQRKDFEARNLQRRRNGLEPWTESQYLEFERK
jgi:hypothetical protein